MKDERLFECRSCGQAAKGYGAAMEIRCCGDKEMAEIEIVADSAEEYPIRGGVLYRSANGNHSIHIKSGECLPNLPGSPTWEQCGEAGFCGHLNAAGRYAFWDVPEHLKRADVKTLAAWIDAR